MDRKTVKFNGEFTKEIRRVMRERRQRLGISFHDVGNVIGVSWSSIRKWENGQVRFCQRRRIDRIQMFIDGYFDSEFGKSQRSEMSMMQFWSELPGPLSVCMERAATVNAMCLDYPEIASSFLSSLSQAYNGAVRELVRAMPLASRLHC